MKELFKLRDKLIGGFTMPVLIYNKAENVHI